MIGGTNQSGSTVGGDQVGRDKYEITLEVKKELATARQVITTEEVSLESFVNIELDGDNTILIQKLKNGGFNSISRKNATLQKLRTVSAIISISKCENGKRMLTDVYMNLMSIINMKYIANLNEGESLKTNLSFILEDLSEIVNKYVGILAIDEAFLEGLLYVATSNCALKWRLDEENDTANDS